MSFDFSTHHAPVKAPFESSFSFHYSERGEASNLPFWHYHPEFQLVFISNGNGKRLIGGHESHFDDGDLILVGPNLPRMQYLQEGNSPYTEIVIQFNYDFLGTEIYQKPEFIAISELFEQAKSGLVFGGHTKWVVAKRLYEMPPFDSFSKLLHLLLILQIMAYAEDVQHLNINHLSTKVKPQDLQRMQAIYEHVEGHFEQSITNAEVASLVNMTTPAFCRFFKKQSQKTFVDFLTEYRIGHARRLLAKDDLGISHISFECGFNNLSHFNKQFKKVVGVTPSAFRKNLQKLVQAPLSDGKAPAT